MKTLFVVVALLTYPKEQAVVFHSLSDNCKVAIHELKQKYEFEWYVCITEPHWRKWHKDKTAGEWLKWFKD